MDGSGDPLQRSGKRRGLTVKKPNLPQEHKTKKEQKLQNPNTHKKNYAGQTQGQYDKEHPTHGVGQFRGAGKPPIMEK
jgi:hypothetical protein